MTDQNNLTPLAKQEFLDPATECGSTFAVRNAFEKWISQGSAPDISRLTLVRSDDNPDKYDRENIQEEWEIWQAAQPPAPEPVIDAVKVRGEAFNEASDAAHDAIHSAIENIDQCRAVKEAVCDAILSLKDSQPSHPASPQQALSDEAVFEFASYAYNRGRDSLGFNDATALEKYRSLLQKAGSSERDAKDAPTDVFAAMSIDGNPAFPSIDEDKS